MNKYVRKLIFGDDKPKIPYRDRHPYPDLYNTGCKGTLTPFDKDTMSQNVVWELNGETQYRLNFNLPYQSAVVNLSDNTTITYENIDFTNRSQLVIYQAQNYTPDKGKYRKNIKIKFKNCLFISVSANYSFPTKDSFLFEFENCSFKYFGACNSILKNCLIGHDSWYKQEYGINGGEGTNPKDWVTFKDCYIMDLETETETQGTGHIDGLQTAIVVDGLIMDNVRFECMDMPFAHSHGDWSYSVFWELVNTNSRMIHCTIHGGGYYQASIKKGNTNVLRNNLISQDYSSPCYPGDAYLQMTDNWATYIDSLLIGSIWEEDGKIKISVSNDLNEARTLRIVDNSENETTFTIPKCPTRAELLGGTSGITEWSDLPFDLVKEISAYGVSDIKIYDDTTLIRSYTVETNALDFKKGMITRVTDTVLYTDPYVAEDATRATVVSDIPNDAPVELDGVVIGYLITIPSDATKVKIKAPNLLNGYGLWNKVNGKITRQLDSGWSTHYGTTFSVTAGQYKYLSVNYKKSNNGNVTDSDMAGLGIEFE